MILKVDRLLIPIDFVVLDVEDRDEHGKSQPVLLGRPFMATSRAVVDVHGGKLTLSVIDDIVEFDMFRAEPLTMKETKDEVGNPSSQFFPESDVIDEFLRTLEEDENTSNDLEARKVEELIDHNKGLLLKIEQME